MALEELSAELINSSRQELCTSEAALPACVQYNTDLQIASRENIKNRCYSNS